VTGPQPDPPAQHSGVPPVVAHGDAGPDARAAHPGSPGARPGPAIRTLDALAGLLSAGILLVGVLLLLAAVIAPTALPAAGLGIASGPGWSSVAVHLAVGVTGELVVLRRRGWPPAVRAGADLVVIAAALLVLWWAWLP
jgi:hypothetical protein